MTDHKTEMAEARDGFAQTEQALRAIAPWARENLTKPQLATFRKARRDLLRTHADLAELAEELNGGSEGEIVPLGGGT